jgi:hypothetical protein
MSTPFGLYGGYKYESPKTRALGSISREQYAKVWDDQGRLMSKIISDVSYMAANQRQMQQGIDQANENVIQQVQGIISDFIVLFGGAGDTGLDFGDLKYVVQALGALFGFADENGNITVPVNLFNVAWHFFSNYILPVNNFRDAIDFLIDSAIASVLDIFGEVPILGQALQQLAVIISDIRDLLDPIADAVQAMFDALNIDLNDITGIGNFFGILKPIWDAIGDALDGINLPDFSLVFHEIALWSLPFVQAIAGAINVAAVLIRVVTGTATATDFSNALKSFSLILEPTVNGGLGLSNIGWGSAIITNLLNPTGLFALLTGGLLSNTVIPPLDGSILQSGNINLALTGLLGQLGLGNIPSLGDTQVPIVGFLRDALAQSMLGGSTTGYTTAQVKSALQAIPGGNIASQLLAARIPPLDGSILQTGNINLALVSLLGSLATGNIPTLPGSKVPDVIDIAKNMFNNWFGGTTAAGTPAEVATTIAAIKTTVAGGFTLQTFTVSNGSWTVPADLLAASEVYAGVVGGGGKGTAGLTVKNDTAGATAAGGSGGNNGGYKRVKVANPAGIGATLAITIGAAASTNGANGGATSIGSLVSSTAGIGSTEVSAEFLSSSSLPGDGGNGGNATTGTRNTSGTGSVAAGSTGGSSATATGGAGGAGSLGSGNRTATAGTVGSAGQTGTTPISGGGGGGGGGGATCNQISGTANATGGAGGAGGYPGGASGGGGGAASINDLSATVTGGAAGTPANGFAFLLWR